MKYIITSIISIIIIVSGFFYFRHSMSNPYESVDDPAWQCTIGKKEAHLLAERAGQKDSTKREALIQWKNGSRSWVAVSELPRYYKLKAVNTKKTALISCDSLEQKLVGKTLSEIESSLAYALEMKGDNIVFPVKVLKKGEAVSSENITVTFKDSVATSVKYTLEPDEKADVYSSVPGIFVFLDEGIRASQRDGYVSNIAKEEKEEAEYQFGDFTIKAIKFIANLLYVIAVFLLLFAVPFIVALPVLFLYCDMSSRILAMLIGIVSELIFLYIFTIILVVFDGPSLTFPVISLLVCTFLTGYFYRYFRYY